MNGFGFNFDLISEIIKRHALAGKISGSNFSWKNVYRRWRLKKRFFNYNFGLVYDDWNVQI